MISNISTLYSENYKSTEMKNKKNTEDVDKRADEKKEIKQVHQESVQEVVVEKEFNSLVNSFFVHSLVSIILFRHSSKYSFDCKDAAPATIEV